VHRSERNSLSPPMRVGTVIKKCVHQRVVKFAGSYQIATKLGDRLRPVVSPSRASVVDGGFRIAAYLG